MVLWQFKVNKLSREYNRNVYLSISRLFLRALICSGLAFTEINLYCEICECTAPMRMRYTEVFILSMAIGKGIRAGLFFVEGENADIRLDIIDKKMQR